MRSTAATCSLLLFACTGEVEVVPEPLDLPADPAARGVPVGVRTVAADGVTLELFYPASDADAASPTEPADLEPFLPDSVVAVLGEIDLPPLDPGMVRDAALRVPEAPYPVVLFSHGFGGFRLQSLDYAVHLASRGYVVVAMDHPGRMLADVLPCAFSPPLDGCNLSFGDDPGERDVPRAMNWLEGAAEEGELAGAIDLSRVGLSGHSAGAGTTATVGNEDTRFGALLPMANAVTITREVPALLMGGSCDFVANEDALAASWTASIDGTRAVAVQGAGHLVFTDLCDLDLGGFAQRYLAGRDDVNTAVLDQLLTLAVDGCPGYPPAVERPECADGFADLEVGKTAVRAYSTTFFDEVLRGGGGAVAPEGLAEGVVVY